MKFEMVEYYPVIGLKKRKNFLGTVHIYVIDCQLDIRGIMVSRQGKGLYFNLPHFKAIDEETGLEVSYPLIRWENSATQKEMMNFLHEKVKPEILKRIKDVNQQRNN